MSGFFQTFWTWLNGELASYIGSSTARVAAALEPAAIALGAVYVMVWGYLMLTGRIEEPFSEGLKRILTLAVVLGAGLHMWLYNTLLVDTFYRAPTELAAYVVGAPDPVKTLDTIWSRGGEVADRLYEKSSVYWWDSVGFCIVAVAVWTLVGLLCLYTMFLLALSSVALSVLLALGPLFIVLLLFGATRRLFEAWIAQLANYALITILTVMVAALMLHLVVSYARQTAALGSGIHAVDALDLLLVTVLVFLFMRQIMPIAAGLAGGVALGTFGLIGRTLGWGARTTTFGAAKVVAPGVAIVGGAAFRSVRAGSRRMLVLAGAGRAEQGDSAHADSPAGDSQA